MLGLVVLSLQEVSVAHVVGDFAESVGVQVLRLNGGNVSRVTCIVLSIPGIFDCPFSFSSGW